MHPRPPTFSLFPYTTLFRSDALDLCLACKGCKADCPVNVDMATYKAEFLSHYYKHRLRPIHAYAFGLIHVRSEEHTSELQSLRHLVCRLLLEKKKQESYRLK